MVKFKDSADAMAKAKFVFASNGQPVPADLESKLYDDGDGNGLKVLVDNRPKMVRKMICYFFEISELDSAKLL